MGEDVLEKDEAESEERQREEYEAAMKELMEAPVELPKSPKGGFNDTYSEEDGSKDVILEPIKSPVISEKILKQP